MVRPRKIDLLFCVPCAKYGTRDAFYFQKIAWRVRIPFFFLCKRKWLVLILKRGGCFKGQIGMKGDKRQVINTVMERNQQFFERYIKQQKYSKDTEKNAGPKQTLNKTTLSKQNSSWNPAEVLEIPKNNVWFDLSKQCSKKFCSGLSI